MSDADALRDPFRENIDKLAAAVEGQTPADAEAVPATRNKQHVLWMIGGICAVAIAAVEIGLIARSDIGDTPSPPARIVHAIKDDSCLARTSAFVDAVARWTDLHGAPPKSLASLTPDFVPF